LKSPKLRVDTLPIETEVAVTPVWSLNALAGMPDLVAVAGEAAVGDVVEEHAVATSALATTTTAAARRVAPRYLLVPFGTVPATLSSCPAVLFFTAPPTLLTGCCPTTLAGWSPTTVPAGFR
jgi:hypothetical protein